MDRYFSVTLVDDHKRTTARKYELEAQLDLAAYAAVASVVAGALEDVTDLGLIRMQLVIPIEDVFSVTEDANVDVGATFSGYVYEGAGKKASLKVPGIKIALVGDGGKIDLEGAEVAAWLALFEEDGGALLLSDGEQISDWIAGTLDK